MNAPNAPKILVHTGEAEMELAGERRGFENEGMIYRVGGHPVRRETFIAYCLAMIADGVRRANDSKQLGRPLGPTP